MEYEPGQKRFEGSADLTKKLNGLPDAMKARLDSALNANGFSLEQVNTPDYLETVDPAGLRRLHELTADLHLNQDEATVKADIAEIVNILTA